jgi:hypothetical protein
LESLGHEVPNPDDVTFDGYSIEQRSRALIATADATIVIWTDHSAESEWVRREATLAAQIGKLFAVHDPQFINFDRLPHPLPNLHSTRVDDFDRVALGLEQFLSYRSDQRPVAARHRFSPPPPDAPATVTYRAAKHTDSRRLAWTLLGGIGLFTAVAGGAYYGLDDKQLAGMLARRSSQPPIAAHPPLPPEPAMEADIVLRDDDLLQLADKIESWQDCRRACRENDQCRGFSYVTSGKACHLKPTATQCEARAGTISGTVEPVKSAPRP